MKYTVHQIRKDRKSEKEAMDARFFGKVDKLFFLTAYDEVCTIEADDLDEANDTKEEVEQIFGQALILTDQEFKELKEILQR